MVAAAVKAELEKNPEEVDANEEWVGPDSLPKEGEEVAGEQDAKQKKKEGMLMPNGMKRRVPWYRCQPYYRPLPEEAIKKGALQERMTRMEKKLVKAKAAKAAAEGAEAKGTEAKEGETKEVEMKDEAKEEPKRKAEEVEVEVGSEAKKIKLDEVDLLEGERQELEDRKKAEEACG